MKVRLVHLDHEDRFNFFLKMENALFESGYKMHFLITSYYTLKSFLKKNYDLEYTFIQNLVISETQNIDLSDTLEFKSKNALSTKNLQNFYSQVVETLKAIYESKPFYCIWMWNGSCVVGLAVKNFTSLYKLKTLFFEVGNLPNKVFVDTNGVNWSSSLSNKTYILKNYSFDKATYLLWKNSYLQNKLLVHNVPQGKKRDSLNIFFIIDKIIIRLKRIPFIDCRPNILSRFFSFLCSYFILDRFFDNVDLVKSKYIFFPLQVSNDSQIILNSKIDNLDALKICNRIASKKKFKLFIKIHPAETNFLYLFKIFKLKNELDFKVIRDNTFQAIKYSYHVITINSTVGLEAMIMGRDVTYLGNSFYKNLYTQELIGRYVMSYLIDVNMDQVDNYSKSVIIPILNRMEFIYD